MPVATCDDEEGFFIDVGRWTEPMAEQIARESGIEAPTDRHCSPKARRRRVRHDREGLGPASPRVHRDDRRHRRAYLRLQGIRRPVRTDQG